MNRTLGLLLAAVGIAWTTCAQAQHERHETGTAAMPVDHDAQTEATRKVATAFLNRYFIEHNFGAYAEFADPDFIQHNPMIGKGVAGHRAYFAKIFAAPKPDPAPPPQAHVIDMVLVDGDIFSVMHHSVNADGKAKLFVDLWRVRDGKIAEHWDVIQDMPAQMPHQNGMGCGFQNYDAAIGRKDSVESPACGKPDPKVKRADSLKNYRAYVAEVGKGDVMGAIDRWLHPSYKQHSPIIKDGKQGAIDYLKEEWGRPDAPKPTLGPQRIVAEGDYVLVHYLFNVPGTDVNEAHIDVFRFTNGKISEHWDVKQPVPATSANGNAMW
ncbi:MAG: nuclear transport factor 2 family protein [Sphingomonadales bacterium]|nr:nuclear transport factor 2 family protein [Sphingomonadales bacterium]